MFKETKEDILMTAALVRQACERYAEKHPDFWEGLGGMCAFASHYLFRQLRKEKYTPTFITVDYYGMQHCWVAVDDFNVDITATQFQQNYSPVYSFVGKPKDHPFFKKDKLKVYTMTSNADIIKLMRYWPPEQILTFENRKLMDMYYAA